MRANQQTELMKTSQKHHNSGFPSLYYHQPAIEIEPYHTTPFQIIDSNANSDDGSQGTNISFNNHNEQFHTLESAPVIASYASYDSPIAVSGSSRRSPFSSQGSPSYISDLHHSLDDKHGSPFSGSSTSNEDTELRHRLRELESMLFGPESEINESCLCTYKVGSHLGPSIPRWNKIKEVIPRLDLKELLICCAQAVEDSDVRTSAALMEVLGQKVSVSGEPIERLGAYMLEGLRAKMESSGSLIYRSLKCDPPTSSELMSSMGIIYQICPYWKFAYTSSNAIIGEAAATENRIHIIDFQIAQGSQWMSLIQTLARRPGGAPLISITGIDDSNSTYARGGGLHIVAQRLSQHANMCNVPFEFHDAAMSGCEVQPENLGVQPGEALIVNLPYILHHMPDESVSTQNHRDRLLRLIKSLSPKVVILVEQESNTNTAAFIPRFKETLDYYIAMFESIDVARGRNDKERINAEQHCVARDIVNMIACEGPERVERHELLGKWNSRFQMAGFSPCPLSSAVTVAVKELLKDYHKNYKLAEKNGALYLGWKDRALSTCSAWR